MKQTFLFSLLVICLGLAMSSCGNKAETTTTDGQTMTGDSMGATATTVPVATEVSPETAEQGVPGQAHYKCTKAGCTGTGDAAGKCPICGTDLAHNAAFHGTPTAPGSTPEKAVTLDPATGKPAITPVAGSATPPPAKNEAGLYHFACSKAGCDGGGAAAGKCPKCGGDLAHNPAYHNK
jgi:hypothetical protein